MNQQTCIFDVMTKDIQAVTPETTVSQAAQMMSEGDVGGLIVNNPDGTICGIVTDRDIVVRAIARGRDPDTTSVEAICSKDPVCLRPNDTIDHAVKTMVDVAVRRIPVLEDGAVVGIVSLGDLAIARQPNSALGAISAAAPQA